MNSQAFDTQFIRDESDFLDCLIDFEEIMDKLEMMERCSKSFDVVNLRPRSKTNIESYGCSLCKQEIRFRGGFKQHFVKHFHPNDGMKLRNKINNGSHYECPLCNYKNLKKLDFMKHIEMTHLDLTPSATQLMLKLTSDSITNGEKVIKKTSFNEDNASSFKKHIKNDIAANNIDIVKCNVCNFESDTKLILDKHTEEAHGSTLYKCPMCHFASSNKFTLIQHINTHRTSEPMQSSSSEKENGSPPPYIKQEEDTVVKPTWIITSDSMYKCSLCSYVAKPKGHMIRHLRTHTGYQPFKCKLCNYRCCQRGTVVSHMKMHANEGFMNCPVCSYSTKSCLELHCHLDTHDENLEYMCATCKRTLPSRTQYKTHFCVTIAKVKVPENMPYQSNFKQMYHCNFCSFSTIKKCALIIHLKKHE